MERQYRQYKPVGACPVCKEGEIVELERKWTCNRRNDKIYTCRLTIWKTMCGVEISEKIVRDLIEKGVTEEKVTGFVSKRTGKTFAAWLEVDPDEKRVVFRFGNRPMPREEKEAVDERAACGRQ